MIDFKKTVFIILCIAIIASLFIPTVVGVMAFDATTPFGGKILSTVFCICSFDLMLVIGPPRGGSFIYKPGVSILYKLFNVWRPGPSVLGTASVATSECSVPNPGLVLGFGPKCIPIGVGRVIKRIGTSGT